MIDTEALRKKVIDLAIKGKLTEQLPEDGDAETLYAQIQDEKTKLIKEGNLKKEKPLLPISTDEIPFPLPNNWKWVRWGNLATNIQYGYNAPAKETGTIKMLRISDIQNGTVNWQSVPFCDIETEIISEYLLKESDILFARTGGTVGKSFIVPSISEPVIFAGYLIRSSYSAILCPYYLKYFMESELYWKQLRVGTTATAQPNCNGQTLGKMILPLPPLAEQKRIVQRVDKILEQIQIIDDLQKEYENNVEVLKKKIIDAGIRGQLTEQLQEDGDADALYAKIQEERAMLTKAGKTKKEKSLPPISESEIPFAIPDNWIWSYLGDLFDHNTGKALNSSDVSGTKLSYITTSNLYWDHFELHDLKSMFFTDSEIEKCTIHRGDLLICEGGDIGRSAIWCFDFEMRIQNHIHRLRGYGGLDHKYFYYIMRNYKDRGLIDGRGIGLQGFSSKRVHGLVVPLPPLAEQKRIVERIDSLFACFLEKSGES